MPKSLQDRFSEKWTPEPFSGCWLWTAGVGASGYGVLHHHGHHVSISAHRAAWEIHKGPIPTHLFVLHRCDTRICVNPNHLFLGIQRDNMRDMTAKGRTCMGENNHMSKLTKQDVKEIRASKQFGKQLSQRFGVTPQTIWYAKRHKTWRHVV